MEVFEALSPTLKEHNFLLRRSKDRFVRQRGDITDMFQLVCLDAKPGLRIQPHVGVRLEQVENLFHQISGFEPKYQKDTLTFGSSIGIFKTGDSRSCEFLLESKSMVGSTIELISQVFTEFALPYFQQWGSLIAIDAELNNKPNERTHHRPLGWEKCSTGIIAAKLVGRANYDSLVTFYTERMTQDNKGFYLRKFQALKELLESVPPGNGLSK